jgi:hypothetical protein
MAKRKTTYDRIGRQPILNGAAVRHLIFKRIERAHRSPTIQRIDGDAVAQLDALARLAIVKVVDKAIEMHPSKFKTLKL